MRGRLPIVLAITMLAGIGVTACTGGGSGGDDTISAPPSATTVRSEAPSATPVATPTVGPTPEPTPDAAAAAAKTRFDSAAHTLATSNAHPDDAAIVNALVNAGFTKPAMQITPDTTSIGRAADSIQVSVLVDGTCLIGQFRGSAFVSETAPALESGKCLIGKTASLG